MPTLPFHAMVLAAVVFTWYGNPQSPIPTAFVLTSLVPLLALVTWAERRRTGRSWSSWVGLALVLALGVGLALTPGFSLCHPLLASLRCAAFLGACWFGARGWGRCFVALHLRTSWAMLSWVLPWAMLVTAPFFAVSVTTAFFPDLSANDVAQTLVTFHPLAAFCDGLGGVDAFREERLYEKAEIGARYAYHLPDVFGHVLVYGALAMTSVVVAFVRRGGTRVPPEARRST